MSLLSPLDHLTHTINMFEHRHVGWKIHLTFTYEHSEKHISANIAAKLINPSRQLVEQRKQEVNPEFTPDKVHRMMLCLVVELMSYFHLMESKQTGKYIAGKNSDLFDLYTANLAIFLQTGLEQPTFCDDEMFVCPLCFQLFGRDDLNNKLLTIEHIPPKKLGGKPRTLTCKSCNNRHGTLLDAHLISSLKDFAFFSGIENFTKQGKFLSRDGFGVTINAVIKDNRVNLDC